jgi:FkbM family methyltransferase
MLPAGHMLPLYQQQSVKYDRFLPHLVHFFGDERSTIIDVGANCGDTLAGMVERNAKPKYLCIEADDGMFEYLTSNIERIRKAIPDLDINAVKSLVGKNISNVSLEGVGGTRHAVVGAGNRISKQLDIIIRDLNCPPVKLLKSDVDGFDWDVIDSAQSLINMYHPILFFECQYDFDYQMEGYEKIISQLKAVDYVDWTIFDNFGEVMLRTSDVEQIFQLMEYLWKQNRQIATRTIYYYDILAVTNKDRGNIDSVLKMY